MLCMNQMEKLTHAILSNSRKYVDFQRYIFEALWKKAIPAKQRVREIQEAIELATYSNSQYTALSFVSIFETIGCKMKSMRERSNIIKIVTDIAIGYIQHHSCNNCYLFEPSSNNSSIGNSK